MSEEEAVYMELFARAIVEGRDTTRLPIEVKIRALASAYLWEVDRRREREKL